jgi:hypothetical protein
LCARAADEIRSFKRLTVEDILRRRHEAFVRAHDKEVLLDFGMNQEVEERTPEACDAERVSLRAVFSWTRFAK